jgi:GNAT superfamily N-acetyltransferase/predicted ABC-type ATPase
MLSHGLKHTQTLSRLEAWEDALNIPFSQSHLGGLFREDELSLGAVQGVLDSYGLGTAIRSYNIPRGNTAPDMGGPLPDPAASLGRLFQNLGDMARGEPPQPSMTEDEYKASPFYRERIPFEPGMTPARAAALAEFEDARQVRNFFMQKKPVAAFLGQFVGQALDPINYVPVFGAGAHAAAAARYGSIFGRAGIASAEAAINTAAFGIVTADIRREFGDDISFEAIITEIAMSALIGGFFGAGIGSIAKGSDAVQRNKVRKLQDEVGAADIGTKQEVRYTLGESVGQLATRGEVDLTPTGMSPIERIAAKLVDRTEGARALAEETAGVTGSKAGEIVFTPDGSKVNVRPEIVDLETLRFAGGHLQVRDRSRFASEAWVRETAPRLNPALLMPDISSDRGAPIVGEDNIIDSGNGRVMAIKEAKEAHPERYEAYKKALVDADYDISGVESPVLISRRVTQLSEEARAQFNQESNTRTSAQMSPAEIAHMDRGNITDDALALKVPGPINSPANRPFVARFVANMSPNDRSGIVDSQGHLSREGIERIDNALTAAAYGDIDPSVMRRFAEATDENSRAIVGAMADVAGEWAVMRRAAKRGDIEPEYDMTMELTQALRLLTRWRDNAAESGTSVASEIRAGMGQLDAFSGELTPEVKAMIRAFYSDDAFTKAVGRDRIADLLTRMVDNTFKLGQPQLFGRPGVSRLDVIRSVTYGQSDYKPTASDLGLAEADGLAAAQGGGERRGQAAGTGQEDGRAGATEGGAVPGAQGVASPTNPAVVGKAAVGETLAEIDLPSGDDISIRKRAADSYEVFSGDKRVATAGLSWRGAYLTSIDVDPAFRRKGVATHLYDQIEADIGRKLFPSPLGLTDEATSFWKRRLADLEPAEKQALLDEAVRVGDEAGVPKSARERMESLGWEEGRVPIAETPEAVTARTESEVVQQLLEWAERGDIEAIKNSPELAQVVAKMRKTTPTDHAAGYGTVEWAANRTYVAADGQPIHSVVQAIDYLIDNARTLAADELGIAPYAIAKDRKAVIVIGPPAAGKSTVANQIALRLKAAIPDADEAKKIMPEYQDGVGASATHEESSTLSTHVLNALLDDGENVVIPKVGASAGSIEKLTAALKESGYTVDLALMDVAPPEAFRRMIGRYVSTGRLIPPDYFDSVVHSPSQVFDQLKTKGVTDGYFRIKSERGLPPLVSEAQSRVGGYRAGEEIPIGARRGDGEPADGRAVEDAAREAEAAEPLIDPALFPREIHPVKPAPEPEVPELAAAETRVGRSETLDEIAESHGVDPTTGDYAERGVIDQIKEEGRLTKEDEAALAEADKTFDDAEAYQRALVAAERCVA